MSTPQTTRTQTDNTQQVASNTVFKSTEVDVSTAFSARVQLWLGKDHASAFTAAPEIVIEGCSHADEAGGDGEWQTLAVLGTPVITASDDEALSGGGEPQDETVLVVAATAGFAVGDKVLIKNTTTGVGNSDWGEVVVVTTNTSLTLKDGLKYAQDNSSTVYNEAFFGSATVPLDGVKRLRAVVKSWGTGQTYCVKVVVTVMTEIS